MHSDECEVGQAVVINTPGNALIDGMTGVVCDRPASDEALIRLDHMKPEFSGYGDLKAGLVTLDPADLDRAPVKEPLVRPR